MAMSSLEKPDDSPALPLSRRVSLRLKRVKSKLPLNGDWLYVTENYAPSIEQSLGEENWDTPDKVFQEINSGKLEVLKLVYERAKAYESIVNSKADHVRDKAKSLLGTVAFVSAVLLGVTSFLVTSIVKLNGWWFIGELILVSVLGTHLVRALLIAMDVMMREVIITSRKEELLLQRSETELHALKCLISQIFSYANKTDEFVRERVNKLILGQDAFRYGVVCFALFLVIQIYAGKKVNEIENKAKSNVLSQTEIQSSILSREEQLLDELRQLKVEIIRIHQDNEDLLKKAAVDQHTTGNKTIKK